MFVIAKKKTPEQLRAGRVLMILSIVFAAGFVLLAYYLIRKYLASYSPALFITVILPLIFYAAISLIIINAVKKRFMWSSAVERRIEAVIIDKRIIDAPVQRDAFVLMVGYAHKHVAPGGFLLVFECADETVASLLVNVHVYEQFARGAKGTLVYLQSGKNLKYVSFT